jgi:hypothetical protein
MVSLGDCSPRNLHDVELSGGVHSRLTSPSFPAILESFDKLTAGINPALETFKSKKTGSSFYPGKGMRDRESFGGLFSA